ncbi:hypothetical protein NYA22BAC_00459 [Parasphingorhabdus sp. NYA22]
MLYERFGKLVADAIAQFRAGRLTEKDYFDQIKAIRDDLVSSVEGKDSVPAIVQGDSLGSAIFRLCDGVLSEIAGDKSEDISANTAAEFAGIVRSHRKVGWQDDSDVENAIRNAMDDYLYDELKEGQGLYGLSVEIMDEIIDRSLEIAKRQVQQ